MAVVFELILNKNDEDAYYKYYTAFITERPLL